jgi:hypothetical protein
VEPPDATLSVTESWFRPDGTGGYDWGAIVNNAGADTWTGPYVVAKFFDAENRLIDADDGYFVNVRPGAGAVVGYVWEAPAEPARIEVTFVDGGFLNDEPEAGELTVSDLSITPSGSGSTTVSGTITSTFESEQSFVEVIMIWRDAANAVVYSASTYVDTIDAGGSAPLELSLYGDNLPTTAPTETYWSG